jgi:hypothetical protein
MLRVSYFELRDSFRNRSFLIFGRYNSDERFRAAPDPKNAPPGASDHDQTSAGQVTCEIRLCVQPVSATPLVVYRLAFRSPRFFADVD